MTRVTIPVLVAILTTCFAAVFTDAVVAAEVPEDRVVVMYFHRTERCPTCKKMGAYSEEAVKSGFKEQIKQGTVSFYQVDFQDKKNERLAKGYHIKAPALIVAKITKNKVAKYTDLEEIWTKANDKAAFLKYVQDGVTAHVK